MRDLRAGSGCGRDASDATGNHRLNAAGWRSSPFCWPVRTGSDLALVSCTFTSAREFYFVCQPQGLFSFLLPFFPPISLPLLPCFSISGRLKAAVAYYCKYTFSLHSPF